MASKVVSKMAAKKLEAKASRTTTNTVTAKDLIAAKNETIAAKDETIRTLRERIDDMKAGAENDQLISDRILHASAGLLIARYLYEEALAAVNVENCTPNASLSSVERLVTTYLSDTTSDFTPYPVLAAVINCCRLAKTSPEGLYAHLNQRVHLPPEQPALLWEALKANKLGLPNNWSDFLIRLGLIGWNRRPPILQAHKN